MFFYMIHFLSLHPRIATSSKASQQAATPLPMICDALLQWLKGCDSKYTNIKVECFPLKYVSGANWIHVSCILQQHSFGKLDFLHWNQLPPLWRLQNSQPKVGLWPHLVASYRNSAVTGLLPKHFVLLFPYPRPFHILWFYPTSSPYGDPTIPSQPLYRDPS